MGPLAGPRDVVGAAADAVVPDSEIRIVEASSPQELADAVGLFRGYAAELGWDLSGGGRFAEEIANPPGPYALPTGALLVAYIRDEPVGVLGVQAVPVEPRVPGTGAESAAELKRLFVRGDCRRLGVGEALMCHAETVARRLGYESVVLTTSPHMMPLAQGLYERLGYRTTTPYRDDIHVPDIRWLKVDL